MGLKEQIVEVDDGLSGTLGVAVKDLKTGEETTVNGDEVFQLASVFKVPVIVTLYRQVDAGEIDLDERVEMTDYARVPGSGIIKELTPGLKLTIRDYRTLMMMISDNTATDMVIGLVGKEMVNDAMLELGLRNTKISTCRDLLFELAGMGDVDPEKRTIQLFNETMKKIQEGKIGRPKKLEMERDNFSTPVDMMTLLEKIYRGEAASEKGCEEIIALMKRCQTGENRIWKHLPRDRVEVAHKTGTVMGVVNDVGVVFPKEGDPYILCAFTKNLIGEDVQSLTPKEISEGTTRGEEAIAKVSRIVYDYFKS